MCTWPFCNPACDSCVWKGRLQRHRGTQPARLKAPDRTSFEQRTKGTTGTVDCSSHSVVFMWWNPQAFIDEEQLNVLAQASRKGD
eukprot:4539602-Alexandrium_andersonii.AAC.1